MIGSGDRICCTFTSYNVLGLLFGGLVVGVSAWLAADKASFFTQLQLHSLSEEEHEEFRAISIVDYGAYILVGVGVAIMLQSLLGCTGTLMGCCGNRKARACLLTYSILVAIVVIMEVVVAVLVLHVYDGSMQEVVQDFLNSTITKDYKPVEEGGTANSVTVLWDHIMTSLECCGVNGFTDFPEQVPAACCSSAPDSLCPDFNSSSPLPQMESGCYSVLVAGTVPALASSLAVVALFQVAGVALACCLARLVATEKREWYELSEH